VLGNRVERAPSGAEKEGLVLDTDDGAPAGQRVHEARSLLADVAAEIETATRIAGQAQSVLSHFKLSDG
jgi:hypothetical protein